MTIVGNMTSKRPKPLTPQKLRQKIARALKKYGYRLGKKDGKAHLKSRDVIVNDLVNVVKSLDAEVTPEWVDGWQKYRYNFDTDIFTVVMTFDVPGFVVFITAWRKTKEGRAPHVD